MTNNDLQYPDLWPAPRIGPQGFTVCLKDMFTKMYRYDIKYTLYGKPENVAYQYAERAIRQKCDKSDVEISNFWMIGDNPKSDIEGGMRIGLSNEETTGINNWKTILLRTGVWKEGEDDYGAHFIVDDMKAAYELIL